MRLFYSVNSPYARMVRILAIEKKLEDRMEMAAVNSLESPSELLKVNPLSKVPALVTEEGWTLCDSSLICEYLDQLDGAPLTPQASALRFPILARALLAKGAIDAAVALVVMSRLPEEQRSPLWKERHENALFRTLERLAENVPGTDRLDISTITLGVLLGYLDFRHPGLNWAQREPKLAAWFASFAQRPSMVATVPRG